MQWRRDRGYEGTLYPLPLTLPPREKTWTSKTWKKIEELISYLTKWHLGKFHKRNLQGFHLLSQFSELSNFFCLSTSNFCIPLRKPYSANDQKKLRSKNCVSVIFSTFWSDLILVICSCFYIDSTARKGGWIRFFVRICILLETGFF